MKLARNREVYLGLYGSCYPVALANFFLDSHLPTVASAVCENYNSRPKESGLFSLPNLFRKSSTPIQHIDEITRELTNELYEPKIIVSEGPNGNQFAKYFEGRLNLDFGGSLLDEPRVAFIPGSKALHAVYVKPNPNTEYFQGIKVTSLMTDYNGSITELDNRRIYASIIPQRIMK